MRNLVTVGLALVLLVAVPARAQNAPDAQDHSFHFSGQMVDYASEEPLKGTVTVFMLHAGRLQSKTATANADGQFELTTPAEPYRALFKADSYAPYQMDDPELYGSTIHLDRFKSLHGVVRDPQQRVVAGVVVVQASYDEADGYIPGWMSDTVEEQQPVSAEDGEFELPNIVPGRYLRIQAGLLDDFGDSVLQLSPVRTVWIPRGVAQPELVYLTLEP